MKAKMTMAKDMKNDTKAGLKEGGKKDAAKDKKLGLTANPAMKGKSNSGRSSSMKKGLAPTKPVNVAKKSGK
jgi:hypothetical protein